MAHVTKLILVLTLLVFGSVAQARSGGPAPGTPAEIATLAAAIKSLSPKIDATEALRAAQVTYDYTYQLAQEYQITDGPLIHNSKVNFGIKPRGLCWHWAQDIEQRLNKEGFKTLEMHRAVANSFNIRLEHSTAIISLKGEDFQKGIVLDPWRKGGVLFWSPTQEDDRYTWIDRDIVNNKKRKQQESRISTRSRAGSATLQKEFQ